MDAFKAQSQLLKRFRNPIIFDCGANTGQTTTEYLRRFPRAKIYAFEPNPEVFTTASAAHGGNPRVVLTQQAVGAEATTLELHLGNNHGTSSFLDRNPFLTDAQRGGSWYFDRTLPVAVCSIDTFCNEHGIDHVHMLKMDLQGYELAALRGASKMLRQKRISVIYAEVLHLPIYEAAPLHDDITNYLGTYGYSLHSYYQAHPSWGDAIYTAGR